MTYRTRPGCWRGKACICGALVKDGAPACVKCLSRRRWNRKKAQRGFNGTLI